MEVKNIHVNPCHPETKAKISQWIKKIIKVCFLSKMLLWSYKGRD